MMGIFSLNATRINEIPGCMKTLYEWSTNSFNEEINSINVITLNKRPHKNKKIIIINVPWKHTSPRNYTLNALLRNERALN